MEQNLPDLVTIQDDNRVTFVHLSFKEYLQRRQDFQDVLLSGRREITRACLKYLKLRDILQDTNDRHALVVRQHLRSLAPIPYYHGQCLFC